MLPLRNRKHHRGPGYSRALSFTEVLVAMAITLVFMGSITTAYVQISNASQDSRLKITAHNRARSAVDQIIRDLRQLDFDPSIGTEQFFVLTSADLGFGDGLDNDGDGLFDEEILNGFDEDGDWIPSSDNHAEFAPTIFEREDYVGIADLGDFNVDEDVLFGRDTLSFRIPANSSTGEPAKLITYEVSTFDGEDNVLIRTTTEDPEGVATVTVDPIVFEVVSLDLLPMNANNNVVSPAPTQRPYWQDEYNADDFNFLAQSPIGAPVVIRAFEFPSSIFIRVSVNASHDPLDLIGFPASGITPDRLSTSSSIVAIDAVLQNPNYTFVRPVI